MASHDLFIVTIPRMAVNDGGYIESVENVKELNLKPKTQESGGPDTDNASYEEMDFKEILEGILINDLSVSNTFWTESLDEVNVEVKFTVARDQTEFVLNNLLSLGVGDTFGHIWVSSLDVNRPRIKSEFDELKPDQQFAESIKSRMIVEKVVEAARASAAFSFDYVALVTVASLLAMLGLAYNNIVVIVASMLVSPIMGPIIAVTFGTIIKDWKLVRMGLYSEGISLSICVLTGYIFGLMLTPYGSTLEWPTEEMNGRGTAKGLVAGVFVAIPSGIGVALSILGNNTSSLVGVAISASLLPPAVNTGMLLAVATLSSKYPIEDAEDTVVKAMYSFLITLLNIAVIFCMALAMFKFKEVAPIPGKTRFWNEDVKMSRQYNGVLRGDEAAEVADKIRKLMPTLREDPEIQALNTTTEAPWTQYMSMRDIRTATDDENSTSRERSRRGNRESAFASLMSIFEEPLPGETPRPVEFPKKSLQTPSNPADQMPSTAATTQSSDSISSVSKRGEPSAVERQV